MFPVQSDAYILAGMAQSEDVANVTPDLSLLAGYEEEDALNLKEEILREISA